MASAISSTGTAVVQDVYSVLFLSTSRDKGQTTGPDFGGIEVWATAGTAVLRFNNDATDLVTVAVGDTTHYWRVTSPTFELDAAGSGGAATVAWRKV